jgi:predicted DNA-binding helix-hairpin-helix protein
MVYLGIIKETREVIEMTMKEYKEMYIAGFFVTIGAIDLALILLVITQLLR